MDRLTAIKSIAAVSFLDFAPNDPVLREHNEFIEAWNSSRVYTLKVFDQMPEDKFDFKYTPESFSFRTQFVHCITFNSAQLSGRLKLQNPFEKVKNWPELSRSDTRKQLEYFYDWVAIEIQKLNKKQLYLTENYGTSPIPVWRLFYALENHIIHHRGQAICYLRLNGITPIGYVGW